MPGSVFQPLTHSLRTLSSVACDLIPFEGLGAENQHRPARVSMAEPHLTTDHAENNAGLWNANRICKARVIYRNYGPEGKDSHPKPVLPAGTTPERIL
jgi:hypothetical protein